MTDAKVTREWGEGPEGDKDVLAFINDTPLLLSLLYDLDLLPEQHPDHESPAWEKIFTITNHWREATIQSLSQEAVRDVALEVAAKLCEDYFDGPDEAWGARQIAYKLSAAIRALKREPNAAGEGDADVR